MTIELYRSEDDSFYFDYFGTWEKVLSLAQLYGWQPIGTFEPWDWQSEETPWEGRYDFYGGEEVSAVDARALATALGTALPDLPDHRMPDRIFETELEEIDREDEMSISFYIIEPNKELNLFEVFGGQYKKQLMRFIAFCQRGGFQIYTLRGYSP
ncbi:MAG: hypothetical protein K8L99_03240 [Anaerolineae bacterium]|nr:hypothetical protein [Anaerolineae bacterium]